MTTGSFFFGGGGEGPGRVRRESYRKSVATQSFGLVF